MTESEPIETESESTRSGQRVQIYDESQKERIVRYLYWGAFLLLSILATVALVGFYSSAMNSIDIWISEDFEPIFRMLFNLAVILATILGISVLLRRLDIPIGESEQT